MSLLKDLHPSVLKAIEADKAQFPNLYKSIITDIQEADLVTARSYYDESYRN